MEEKERDLMDLMESVADSLEQLVKEIRELRSVWETALSLPRELPPREEKP